MSQRGFGVAVIRTQQLLHQLRLIQILEILWKAVVDPLQADLAIIKTPAIRPQIGTPSTTL